MQTPIEKEKRYLEIRLDHWLWMLQNETEPQNIEAIASYISHIAKVSYARMRLINLKSWTKKKDE